jgi:hypothetical protein
MLLGSPALDESGLIIRHDLGAAVATVNLADCRLSFHEQRTSTDIWCLATGPRGTLAMPLVERAVFEQVQSHRLDIPGGLARRARERYAKWQRVAIGDDLLLAVRVRGDALDFEYLFSDGMPFGGGSAGLPTARRPGLVERTQMWLSGRRGAMVHYARHSDDSPGNLS